MSHDYVYFAATDLINGNVAAQNLLSIENPAVASPPTSVPARLVVVRFVAARGISAAAAIVPFLYRLARTTAPGFPSAGTPLTAQKRRSIDPAPVAIVRSGPTATGAAGCIASAQPGLVITAAGAAVPSETDLVKATQPDPRCIILAPGEAVLVSADANTADWRHSVCVEWHEGPPILRVQGP